jgi:predicted RNA-binding protein with PUA-like domain
MARWLFKSEPDAWSWDDQVMRGDAGEPWDGVRNYAARNHMRAMAVGDLGLFYHSGGVRAAVGVVEVIAPAAQDPTTDDPRWDYVTLRAIAPLPRPVTLAEIKAEPDLSEMALVRQPRLSVQPVTENEWSRIKEMASRDPKGR